jgi:hypothetical protein
MGAYVNVNTAVLVDTIFDVTVYYEGGPGICSGPYTGASFTQYFQIEILAGNTSSNFNACTNGYYLPGGAYICGACITACDNPSINLAGYSC